ncbi:MAG: hypothetical protein ACJ735_16775 [Actinomycetes bacterium]
MTAGRFLQARPVAAPMKWPAWFVNDRRRPPRHRRIELHGRPVDIVEDSVGIVSVSEVRR